MAFHSITMNHAAFFIVFWCIWLCRKKREMCQQSLTSKVD